MALITLDPGNKDMKSIMGKVVLFGLIGALGYGFYQILPSLIAFAENTIYLGAMIGGITLVGWWLASGGARAIKYAVYGLSQFALGWVIEMNPFNILNYRLEQTEKSAEDLLKYKSKLEAKASELKEKLDKADNEMKNAISQQTILTKSVYANTASENDQDNLELAISSIGSNKDYIDGIVPVYNDLLRLLDFTQRAYRTATLELTKAKKDLSKKRDLYETVTTASGMVKKAWAALIGDDSLNKDADKAIEALRKDISAKIGAIKTGIKVTSQFMDGKDLENAAKLQTTLKELKGIDLDAQTYSSTLNDNATKIELGNLKGGTNKYSKFLDS